MSIAAAVSAPVANIEAKASIESDDVQQLQQMVRAMAGIGDANAEVLLQLEKHCQEKDSSWQPFYVDTLTDFLIWQSPPKRRVGIKGAKLLSEYVGKDERVDGPPGLELLASITHWSVFCQEPIVFMALKAVQDSVLTPGEALYGPDRASGVITAADVYLVRRALYASPIGSGYSLSRRQADLLFDLNDGSDAVKNDEGWQELFVKAVASHMIYPRGITKGMVPDDFKTRDEWVEECRAAGLCMAAVGQGTAGEVARGELEALDVFGRDAARRARYSEEQRFKDMLLLEHIGEEAAHWLLGRIAGADSMNPNTLAVLQRLRHGAGHPHAYLADVLQKLDI